MTLYDGFYNLPLQELGSIFDIFLDGSGGYPSRTMSKADPAPGSCHADG